MRRILALAAALALSLPAMGAQKPDPQLRAYLVRELAEKPAAVDLTGVTVWLADMSHRLRKRIPSEPARLELLKHVYIEAHRAQMPPELVLAVIDVESNFNQYAVSRAGARGYMQVMPFWLREIGRPNDNLFNLQTNLRMGIRILRYYRDMEEGSWARALARYNGSLADERKGRGTYATAVLRALRARWS